jgi:hypothetical protein
MEWGTIAEDNFGCKKFVIFKSCKKVRAKYAVDFFVLGNSYVATVGTYNF